MNTPPISAAALPAIVLFAHGSRDPLWPRPIEAVAERVRALSPGRVVRCAYLELTAPDLQTVVAELAARGCERLRILPMFLGVGRHAREDLPALVEGLRQAHPAVQIELQRPVGEDDQVIEALARVSLG